MTAALGTVCRARHRTGDGGSIRMPFLFGCNVIGGLLWGAWVPRYLLGGIGFVHPHIELILIAVVVASGLPLFLSFARTRLRRRTGDRDNARSVNPRRIREPHPGRNTSDTPPRIILGAAAVVATAAVLAGCGTSGTAPSGSSADSSAVTTAAPENNPAGDIPDNQVFVPFAPPGGLFTVSVPEGWARTTEGAATVFTDKSNAVRIGTYARAAAPNTESVSVDELPAIASSTAGYRPGSVDVVERKAGQVILITYQGTSPPNPVTGKAATEAIERYEFWRGGHEVVLTLSGALDADNVDPWRTITDSLQWN
jgi:hypothetical protein